MLGLESVPQRMCFKCAPERFAELCEYEGIVPAPYVGRYKWVLLQRLGVLRDDELEGLIQESYEMVAAKAGTGAKSSNRKSRARRTGAKTRSK